MAPGTIGTACISGIEADPFMLQITSHTGGGFQAEGASAREYHAMNMRGEMHRA